MNILSSSSLLSLDLRYPMLYQDCTFASLTFYDTERCYHGTCNYHPGIEKRKILTSCWKRNSSCEITTSWNVMEDLWILWEINQMSEMFNTINIFSIFRLSEIFPKLKLSIFVLFNTLHKYIIFCLFISLECFPNDSVSKLIHQFSLSKVHIYF